MEEDKDVEGMRVVDSPAWRGDSLVEELHADAADSLGLGVDSRRVDSQVEVA